MQIEIKNAKNAIFIVTMNERNQMPLSKEQVHRILEDLQRNGLSLKSFQNKANLLKNFGKQHSLPVLETLAEGIENDSLIVKEGLDALFIDIQGMLNGAKK